MKSVSQPGALTHACSPSTWDTDKVSEFKANLIYRVNYRISRATFKSFVSKQTKSNSSKRRKEKEMYIASLPKEARPVTMNMSFMQTCQDPVRRKVKQM